MQFPFYPKHEPACPNVGQCPHLGGAALGTLVLRANSAGEELDRLHRTLDAERKRNSELVAEKLRLEQELAQVKLELKLERQNKFATNAQKNGDSTDDETASPSVDDSPVTDTISDGGWKPVSGKRSASTELADEQTAATSGQSLPPRRGNAEKTPRPQRSSGKNRQAHLAGSVAAIALTVAGLS